MNKIFTLITSVLCAMASTTKAQIVLNEVYPDPGSGRHEFFELYNTGTSSKPLSLDGYTVMSYFEEGTKRGFYILDLPNLTVGPRSFFTGAAATPFNYQGTTNTPANISWNNPSLTAQFGYLRRWVDNGTNQLDGNKNYDIEPLPLTFNDFFSKRGGSGASYNAFIFKNGVLVNTLFGGSGGTSSMPTFITTMPNIRVEQIMASGLGSFNINFKSFTNKPAEFVGQDVGTDNGFIRNYDGTCGSWTKSSATVNHTPNVSNGQLSSSTGDVTVAAYLTRDAVAQSTKLTYNVTAASAASFPIDMEVYVDNGTVPGELDAADTYVETKTEKVVTDGPFSTIITPYTANALVVVKQAAGCLDKVMFRDIIGQTTLPISLLQWSAKKEKEKVLLQWQVADNELLDNAIIERSTDGRSFSAIALVFSTDNAGYQQYSYKDNIPGAVKLAYRLKIKEKDGQTVYSKIAVVEIKPDAKKLMITQNPVRSQLTLQFRSDKNGPANVAVYNMMGNQVFNSTIKLSQGANVINLPCTQLNGGNYMVQVEGSESAVFLKM